MRQLPTGTVTFLFTDIEGSTRLLDELGAERYAEELADHRNVLREAFARHGGVEVDTQGDAFFVAFPTAPGALAAASEARAGLEIPVRMGLHTGTPLLTEEGYVGPDVHRAARIAGAGHGRQLLVSASTALLLEPSNTVLLDLGEHRLKDLSAAERIYQAGEGEFPRLKTLYQTNLPVPATAFVGREQEVAEASELLVDGVRILTLSGPGGTGKTRLALQAAAAAADGYPDGIWWVSLAPLSDPALVLPTAGEVLGAKRDLAVDIGEKRLLLLLDNFEHVIDAAGEVGALVAACPRLTVLVTSRERLQLAGEHEYAVPAMASTDGLELFAARARALGTEVNDDESPRELCERLDNLPLALELAAARTKLFTPAQLLERLGQRLDLFKGGRDADPRQRTLRAAIEWSYDLLTPEEQQLFARLSVFAGGCTYGAAAEICDADEDTLQSLLDKSLLRRREGAAGELRYWMLETIREFAVERLLESGDGQSRRRRHADWHARLACDLSQPLRAGDTTAGARVSAEVDNFRAALDWSAENGVAENVFRLVDGLWSFWVSRGHGAEGIRWANWVLQERNRLPAAEAARPLSAASELIRFFGDADVAFELKDELIRVFDQIGDESEAAATVADVAAMRAMGGETDPARELVQDALERRRRIGHPGGIAHALATLGMVEFLAGNFELARAGFEDALALFDQLRPADAAHSAFMSGEAARRLGDREHARKRFAQALELHKVLGQRAVLPEILQEVAAFTDDPVAAATLIGASERIGGEVGVPTWDPDDHGRTVAMVRQRLGAATFEALWQKGRLLDDDDALKLAIESLD
jgi:predicted ATPase